MSRSRTMETAFIQSIDLPADRAGETWKPFPLFREKTANARIGCHYSVLAPGGCPHPPHVHVDEEILVVLDGKATIVLAESPDDPAPRTFAMERGQFSYYPSGQHHTIRNDSERDITYLMFRWSLRRHANRFGRFVARRYRRKLQMPTGLFNLCGLLDATSVDGVAHADVFKGRSAWLRRFNCHLTRVAPGAGYDAHADRHDVAILPLDGQIETNGERVTDSGIVYFPAGVEHDMHNPGTTPATYLVFEFRGRK